MSIRTKMFPAIALVVCVLLIPVNVPASAQSANDLGGLVGRWQINLSKTRQNRQGPDGKYTPRSATYTYIYSVQGQDLKVEVYEKYPQAAPNRSEPIITDGKVHSCTGDCAAVGRAPNPAREESHTYFEIDSHLFVRLTHLNGKITEYFSNSLSADGKTMTQIIWSPETPEWQSIYVYEKQ